MDALLSGFHRYCCSSFVSVYDPVGRLPILLIVLCALNIIPLCRCFLVYTIGIYLCLLNPHILASQRVPRIVHPFIHLRWSALDLPDVLGIAKVSPPSLHLLRDQIIVAGKRVWTARCIVSASHPISDVDDTWCRVPISKPLAMKCPWYGLTG